MTPANVHRLFERLKAANPHPKTELHFKTHFECLVAVVLSAQATDVGVNKATAKLFPVANTPQAFLDLGLAGLKSYVKSIGLYNTKAENLMKTSKILIDEYQGKVPSDRKALESLPGVGRKTANIILSSLFGEDTIAVDTHIFRVANRTGLAHGSTPLKVEQQLYQVIPKEFLHDAHHWLVLHGRYICTARKPKCPTCPIRDLCEYPDKTE